MFVEYAYLCLILLVVLAVFVYRIISNGIWVVVIPFAVISFVGMVSSLYLESGIYIIEQDKMAYPTGATLRLIIIFFWFWLCFGVISKYFRLVKTNNREIIFINKMHVNLSLIVSFLLVFLAIINVYVSGEIPLFSEGYVSRFGYLQNTKLWPLLKLFGVSTTIIPLLSGISYAAYRSVGDKSGQKIGLFVLLMYIMYIIIIGNKFGGVVYGIYYFFVPMVMQAVMLTGSKRVMKKFFVFGLLISLPVFGLVYYHYSTYFLAYEYGGPLKFILYRIFALQGHVWWGIDHYIFLGENAQFLNIGGAQHSMPTMMRIVAGTGIESAIDRGVNFTFGFPASPILFFGTTIGLVLISVIAMIMAVMARLVMSSIVRFDIVQYILSAYILVWLTNVASMGSLEMFVQPKFIAGSCILFLYMLIKNVLLGNGKLYGLQVQG